MDRARIKRLAAEFNALHVGYFAVSPCTVKVQAGAHACVRIRIHLEIGQAGRFAPFASRASSCPLAAYHSFVRSAKKNIFLCEKNNEKENMMKETLESSENLHNIERERENSR